MKSIVFGLLMVLSGATLACQHLLPGQYKCIYKDGSHGHSSVFYGADLGGRYVIVDGLEESKIYLHGNRQSYPEDRNVEVVANCSEDQKSLLLEVFAEGTETQLGHKKLSATHSPGMNISSNFGDFSEEAFCYRLPLTEV